ncbi:MAG: cell wall hydrolase [Caulobacteraceae bacterium]
MGLILGACYLASGAGQAAVLHARTARIADAAAPGFSDEALQAEAAGMEPGALAVARRHDPFTAAGAAERDRDATLMAARLVRPRGPAAMAQLVRANYRQTTLAPAAAFHPLVDNPLESARDLECLSDAVYYEARGEGRSGQAAVAQVVINRVRHPAFPKTVCGVVFQGVQSHACQFSFACNGAMRRPKEANAWREARAVAARALSGFVMAEVGRATHFHVAGIDADWGGRLLRVAQVGAHVFYRFGGGATAQAVYRHAADTYSKPSELAERPVYADHSDSADSADGAADAKPMLLAAAVTTVGPLGEGGPLGPPTEPASAPKAHADAAKPTSAAAPAAPDAAAKTAS